MEALCSRSLEENDGRAKAARVLERLLEQQPDSEESSTRQVEVAKKPSQGPSGLSLLKAAPS